MPDSFDKTSMSLLGRARVKDDEAWNQLVHLYGPLVQKWCRQAGLKDDDVADVFQETFQTVARKIDSFKPTKSVASFRSWLKTIVRTRTIDHIRKVTRQAEAAGGTAAHMQIAEVPDPFDDETLEQSQADDALVVQRALELIRTEFEERNWNAFIQVAMEGRSASEVAEEIGVGAQVIRQANYRIRRRLKIVLADLVDTDGDAI